MKAVLTLEGTLDEIENIARLLKTLEKAHDISAILGTGAGQETLETTAPGVTTPMTKEESGGFSHL